jgi:hypothetical protein
MTRNTKVFDIGTLQRQDGGGANIDPPHHDGRGGCLGWLDAIGKFVTDFAPYRRPWR